MGSYCWFGGVIFVGLIVGMVDRVTGSGPRKLWTLRACWLFKFVWSSIRGGIDKAVVRCFYMQIDLIGGYFTCIRN